MTTYTDKATEVKTTLDSAYVAKTDIVDNLTTNDSTKVLSAKQGKELSDKIGTISNVLSNVITYINQ